MIPPQYETAAGFSENLAAVGQGQKFGYIDLLGNMAIKAQFDEVSGFHEGLAAVKVAGPIGTRWGFINTKGQFAIPARFEAVTDFVGGTAAVKMTSPDGGKWGYIDKSGQFVILPRFRNAASFASGLASVELHPDSGRETANVWGFVDRTGTLAIPAMFDRARSFSDGLAAVDSGGKWGYIDRSGAFVSMSLNAKGGCGRLDGESETFVAHTLRGDGCDASEDGTGRGTPLVPTAFSAKDHGADAGPLAPTLRAMPHDRSHANAGGQVAVCFESRVARNGRGGPSELVPPLKAQSGGSGRGDGAPLLALSGTLAVRRLTPRECERLQGMPDDYTLIPYRGKPAADGPRYRAIGNSMAVPVMRWIGRRMQMVDSIRG
jgi:hypothetical protein